MSELSVGEQQLLLAAFAASPQHWFRAQIVGQRVGLSDRDTSELVRALAEAGLMNADPDRCAQLTDTGRAAATSLLHGPPKSPQFWRRSLWLCFALATCLGVVGAAFWLVARTR